MPISRFLTHRVSVTRRVALRDELGDPLLDGYGQPVVRTDTIASDVPASIQPRSAREQALTSQAGAAISDHTLFLAPRDITTADAIVHDPRFCPLPVDPPEATYAVVAVPSAAGAGHHLEVAARLVEAPGVAAVAQGSGS
jgi:head-tail adaptor